MCLRLCSTLHLASLDVQQSSPLAGIEHWGHVTLLGVMRVYGEKNSLSRQRAVTGTSLLYLIVHREP